MSGSDTRSGDGGNGSTGDEESMRTLALDDLCEKFTRLNADAVDHLQHLVASWGLIADLSFSDLLLFAPAKDEQSRFVVLGLARPTTAQTVYADDPVGNVEEDVTRPYVARAWRSGEICAGDTLIPRLGERVVVKAIPVRYRDAIVAVMTIESLPTTGRRPSLLERNYVETAEQITKMITAGTFPFSTEALEAQEAPRVGDGIIRLDGKARITYASPNAVSALRRLGVKESIESKTLADLGIEDTALRTAFTMLAPVSEEVESDDSSVAFSVIPIVESGSAVGAVILARDVTDIRSRDKLLLTKDATIREIHHRVKNNLQTIASLLRLQGRRLASPEAKRAIEESVRRIRAIALVHEVLSREAGEQIPFKAIVRPLLAMVEEALVSSEANIAFTIEGDAPDLPVEIATPLAIVLTELVQNAVLHGFPREEEGHEPSGEVQVRMAQGDGIFTLEVIDDGIGLPADFSPAEDARLGMQIVQTLVEGELGGEIEIEADKGTCVRVRVPTAEPLASE
ncbi:MAG: ATPase [Acidobacteria bacterium]|nr:MAG: ATPase [Acidobacteriota bacterium]